jgi:ABC-type multidrug transport system fused ATPase/permease subunit
MRDLYAYVWRSSAIDQIVLIVLAVIAAVLASAPLELQRHIVNTLAGHEAFGRLGWLCGGYLGVALSLSGLKYIINIRSSGLGERTIRSLRREIVDAFSFQNTETTNDQAKKGKSGGVVAMVSSQAEAVGKFVGDGISTPIVQAGTLLSVLGYMLYTEPRLGLVVLLIALPQVYLVPVIQRRINVQVKARAHTLLRVGDLIVDDARRDDGSADSRQGEIGEAFTRIYGVRLRTFRLKFGLKLLVSASQAVGVFVLLFVGGAMVLAGKTEIGIVVAFISGLERVLDPWRELIAFVRSTAAAKVQFELIESAFGHKFARNGGT